MGIVRFLLALAIIQYHVGTSLLFSFLNNNTTIAAFFVISGFSVAYAVSKKYSFTKKGLISYYKNRIFRIYPLYFIALIVALMIQWWIYPRFGASSLAVALPQLGMKNVLGTIHYVWENLTLCNGWHAWEVTPPTIPLIVLPAWTLLVEFWFYLFAPFLNRLSNKWLLGVFCLSMIVRYITFHRLFGIDSIPDNQFFPNQLVYFAMGIFSYRFSSELQVKQSMRRLWILAILCGLILFGSFVSASGLSHWLFLVILSLSLPSIQPLDYQLPLIKFLGELSYPLFLFHLPVVWVGMIYMPQLMATSVFGYVTVLVVCMSIYLSVRPMLLRLRQLFMLKALSPLAMTMEN